METKMDQALIESKPSEKEARRSANHEFVNDVDYLIYQLSHAHAAMKEALCDALEKMGLEDPGIDDLARADVLSNFTGDLIKEMNSAQERRDGKPFR
tara:strand:+ start:2776 stop:3066 length:291 start_codon:yes stop_codon:yes gene_type:complete